MSVASVSSATSSVIPSRKWLLFSASNDRLPVAKSMNSSQFSVKSPVITSGSNFSPTVPRLNRFRRRVSDVDDHCGFLQGDESVEAQGAVAEILHEAGASKEEAIEIASKSPLYTKMLIDSVRELDELSLWDSCQFEEEEEEVDKSDLSFKRKIRYMAREKKDNGILPFLESVGLNPSSSTYIARYLSSEKLVDLIKRVKYVKQMFFYGSDQEMFIGKNARRMMQHLSISIDDDIQRTLSFFEKMEAKRGGLTVLGSKDVSFPYLIESFPRLLLRSVESQLNPLVEFLEAIGVPKARIRVIFLCFPPIAFYDIENDVKSRLRAWKKVGFEDRDIGRMSLKYPWILSTSIRDNYDKILSFFDMEKVPKTSVDCAIKSWPHLLGCSTIKMNLMVVKFSELGVTNKNMGRVIVSSPQLLLRKPHEFLKVVSFMEELGFDEESIGRILSRCPEIFAANLENTLKKKLKFFDDLGITNEQLCRVIRKYPELFVSDVNNTVLPRMTYLMKIGLSKREVASMVYRFSPLLGYSIEEVLRPKVEFLVTTMNKPIKEIVDYPRYFSYSLDKKIKPRFWLLRGREVECSLMDMLGKNDEDFAAEFMGIGRILVPLVTDNLN